MQVVFSSCSRVENDSSDALLITSGKFFPASNKDAYKLNQGLCKWKYNLSLSEKYVKCATNLQIFQIE